MIPSIPWDFTDPDTGPLSYLWREGRAGLYHTNQGNLGLLPVRISKAGALFWLSRKTISVRRKLLPRLTGDFILSGCCSERCGVYRDGSSQQPSTGRLFIR